MLFPLLKTGQVLNKEKVFNQVIAALGVGEEMILDEARPLRSCVTLSKSRTHAAHETREHAALGAVGGALRGCAKGW